MLWREVTQCFQFGGQECRFGNLPRTGREQLAPSEGGARPALEGRVVRTLCRSARSVEIEVVGYSRQKSRLG